MLILKGSVICHVVGCGELFEIVVVVRFSVLQPLDLWTDGVLSLSRVH